MSLFDLFYDWLIHLLPDKLQWFFWGLLILVILIVLGWAWHEGLFQN